MKKIFSNRTFVIMCTILTLCLFLLSGCGTTEGKISVDSVQISKKNVYLAEGQTTVISAQVYPFNAENQNVIWKSSNEAVVTIEDGFVVAKKAGDAVIEVISEEGGYKDTCNVLVTTASDNLALNDYNNLNMPPKELEPIYHGENTSKKISAKKMAKNFVKRASAEVQDEKESAKQVLEDIKTELKNGINQLEVEKQNIKTSFASITSKNNFAKTFENIHQEMLTGMQNLKQEMLQTLEETTEQLEKEETTAKKQEIDGVTFVVIS